MTADLDNQNFIYIYFYRWIISYVNTLLFCDSIVYKIVVL